MSRKMSHKTCKFCGKSFIDQTQSQMKKYCSNECYKKSSLKRNNLENKKDHKGYKDGKIFGICEYCKKRFQKKVKNQRFCSEECRLKDYDAILNFKRPPKNREPRWLKLRFKVFLRDNFTCQYCGRNVKEDFIKLHVEHIIPKFKGGLFILNNLTTSCSECNYGKGCVLLNERKINKK